MTYREAIEFLYPLHRFGIKPGLERVRELLALLGSPQQRLGRVVHVAGTNGKGTVASATAAIFHAAGLKTALYTSPHLVDFTERMRVDGRPIPQERVASWCSRLREAIVEGGYTFFEATTAIAFAWFAEEGVEAAVIETGMGGRLDATSVVEPSHALVTTIGLDHTEWLGDTLEAIAAEKAAIIKPGSIAYTAVEEPSVLAVISDAARECGAPLRQSALDARITLLNADAGQLRFDLESPGGRYAGLEAPLTGAFHACSLALAVLVAEDAGIGEEAVRRGLLSIAGMGYRARLEKIASRPDFLLDVSHNAPGMQASVGALRALRSRYAGLRVLIGLASDKDARAMVRALGSLNGSFVTVPIPSERSVDAAGLASLCREEGFRAVAAGSLGEGLELLRAHASPDDLLLATGSFYLAGALLEGG